MKKISALAAMPALLALGGCFSFGADPPAALLRLTPDQTIPAQTSRSGQAAQTITVVEPTASRELQTNRVPVQATPTTVAYLKDAQWVEVPAALFRDLLSETIAARTGRVVLDAQQFTFDPGTRLTGQLKAFGVNAATMEVVVTYDAALARSGTTVETRRFEARAPIPAVDPASVGPALNSAANQVATAVAGWVGG